MQKHSETDVELSSSLRAGTSYMLVIRKSCEQPGSIQEKEREWLTQE